MGRQKRDGESRIHVFVPKVVHKMFSEKCKENDLTLEKGIVLAMANQIRTWLGETPVIIRGHDHRRMLDVRDGEETE